MSKVSVLAAAAALLLLAACAAEPESGTNGTCSLSCSQPRVGASNYKVRQLGPPTVTMACVADFKGQQLAPTNGPVQVRYQIYEEVENSFPTDNPGDGNQGGGGGGGATGGGTTGGGTVQDGGAGGGGGGTGGGDAPYVKEEPKAGIGFEPLLYGLLDVGKSNDEFKSGTDSVTSFKYAGVVTSSSEWCSDSCGVISYEFWPDCKNGGSHDVTAGLAVSGGAQADAYTFTISNDSN